MEVQTAKLGIYIVWMNLTPQTYTFAVCPHISQTMFSAFPIHVSWEPDPSYHVKMATIVSLSW